jgi:hypothetical protein
MKRRGFLGSFSYFMENGSKNIPTFRSETIIGKTYITVCL